MRVLTDPALANPNKTVLYRLMNVNGYEAFYPKGVPEWAAAAEGAPAADASRVYVSRWRSPAAVRAGVGARLSAGGIEQGPAWPLAFFVDALGRRVGPDPHLWIEGPSRWKVWGEAVPLSAAAVAFSVPRYPGWRASLNGAAAPLSRWDGEFQKADLPPGLPRRGAFDLRLEFVPTGWALLAALMAAAWAWWLAALYGRFIGGAA
jgi:hypothetical protein